MCGGEETAFQILGVVGGLFWGGPGGLFSLIGDIGRLGRPWGGLGRGCSGLGVVLGSLGAVLSDLWVV